MKPTIDREGSDLMKPTLDQVCMFDEALTKPRRILSWWRKLRL